WGEPFGRVCIEAFAHGVAVIAARSGALPEIVEDGKSGLTFPAGDDEALAACLRRVTEDRAHLSALQHGALKRVRDYSPARLGTSLETFLGSILNQHTKRAGSGTASMAT